MTDDVRSPVLVIADHFHNQRSAVERLVQRRIPDDNDERSVVAQLRSAQLSTQTPITNFPFTGKRQVATTVHPISCSLHGVLHDRHTPTPSTRTAGARLHGTAARWAARPADDQLHYYVILRYKK